MQQPKFKNNYRIGSHRLQNWDYANDGFYFVTICTKDKQYFFGEVKDQEMILNEIGKMAEKFWLEIPQHFDNVELDEFVVMPNHIHGIIGIKNDLSKTQQRCVETQQCCVSTEQQESNTFYKLKPKSLPVIIRSFKSACTREINKSQNQINFKWQSRYYDHIIRNEESLNKIRQYIFENPLKWVFDEENLEFKNNN